MDKKKIPKKNNMWGDESVHCNVSTCQIALWETSPIF